MKLSEDDKCDLDLALRHAIERIGGDFSALESEAQGTGTVAAFARLCLKVRKSRAALGYVGGEIEITEGEGAYNPTSEEVRA